MPRDTQLARRRAERARRELPEHRDAERRARDVRHAVARVVVARAEEVCGRRVRHGRVDRAREKTLGPQALVCATAAGDGCTRKQNNG